MQCRNMSRIKRGETGSALRRRRCLRRRRLRSRRSRRRFYQNYLCHFPKFIFTPPANLLKSCRPRGIHLSVASFESGPLLLTFLYFSLYASLPSLPVTLLSLTQRATPACQREYSAKQQPLAYYLYDWEDGIKLSVQPKCNNIHYYANVRAGSRGYGLRKLASYFCYLPPTDRGGLIPVKSAINTEHRDHAEDCESAIVS